MCTKQGFVDNSQGISILCAIEWKYSKLFIAPGKGGFTRWGSSASRDGAKNYSCFLAICQQFLLSAKIIHDCQRFVSKNFHKRLSTKTNPSKKSKYGCKRETTAV